MKKLFLILLTLLSLNAIGQGVFTAQGDLAPTGNYPVTRFGSAQTGYWPLTTLTERDAIPAWQRTYGMMVYVKEKDSTYTLKSATLDNSNWVSIKQGSVDVSNLMKYSDTASLSNRIDLKINTLDLNALLASYLTTNNYLSSQTLLDSMAGIRAVLDTKLSMADTASLSNRIDQKLNKTDTATLSDRINQRVMYSDSNAVFITLKQLRDSLATISSGSSGISLNVDRPITRNVGGVQGQNLGAGGKTVAQFLDAFFFPSVAATPPTTTLTTTTTSFPYSTWKNWPGGPNFTTSVNFAWSLTNQSKLDASDDKNITSIDLMTGGSSISTVTPDNSGTTQSGTFSAVPFTKTGGDPTTSYSQSYALRVVDAQPNTVTSTPITLTASAANRLTVSGLTLTPSAASNIYEYTAGDLPLTLGWTVNTNDESIISETADLIAVTPLTQRTQATTFPINASGGSKTFTVKVVGNLYSSGSTQSITATWANKLYCGLFTSAVSPDDGTFTFPTSTNSSPTNKVLALPTSQLGGSWKNSTGYNFTYTTTTGDQYLAFAYPDDGAGTPTVQYYDTNSSTWQSYLSTNVTVLTQSFVNENNYSSTYKIVFLNMPYINVTVKIRLQ